MAKQTINIGTTANDRTGDPLRTAFTKTNSNFTELYANVATLNSSVVTDVSDLTDTEGLLFSGDYRDLSNTPFIGTDVSDLTDNSNLLTIKDHIELTGTYQASNTIISFTKPPNTDSNTVFDAISEYVILTRDASGIGGLGGGIYNSAFEVAYDVAISPISTIWNAEGWDDVSDIETRYYQTFRQALRNSVGANIVGAELIMKDIASNEYYKIKFSQWAQGASHDGSFAYTREKIDTTTPIGITFYDGSTLPKAPNTKPKFEQSYVGDFGGYGLTIEQAGRQVYIYDNIVEIPSYNEHNFKIGDVIQIVTGGFASTIRPKVNADIELPDATLYIQGETNSVASFVIPARSMVFLSKISLNGWQLSISEPFFNAVGESIFPTLTVPISDNINPNGTGQILKFGDSTQQAIIYGPESTSSINTAERVIIQGAPGYTNTSGEGGDIYVWAGPGGSESGNGGDIKIRAGLGNGSGNGGYLNLQAGDSFNGAGFGGYINIESGESSVSGNGGDITVQARSGGEITLRTIAGDWLFGSDGTTTFPNNSINSGSNGIELKSSNYSSLWFHGADGVWQSNPSSNENAYVYVQDNGAYIQNYRGADGNGGDTWDHTWEFTNNGNLTLPQGGTISETTIGINPTVVITPAGADSPNQALYVKGGLPPELGPDDYHLHLTTGDLTDTSIIVGTDDHNIRTTIDGGIELNSYNYNTSTQHTLAFGTDGAITTNNELTINVSAGIPDSISNINSDGGWNSSPYTNLSTTGGTGTGLTVNASSPGSGYLDTITINTAGSGYANGDIITIENENNLTATFAIGIAAPITWEFGLDSGLTFPDATVQTTAWTGGIPPTSSKGAIGDKVGMIASDSGYLYVCTADYTNGTPDIWSRTAVTASTW
jgi:hypothetical protein